jgi:hypothetical protein
MQAFGMLDVLGAIYSAVNVSQTRATLGEVVCQHMHNVELPSPSEQYIITRHTLNSKRHSTPQS